MIEKVAALKKEIETNTPGDPEDLEQFRLKYLSKKGLIAQLFSEFKHVPPDQKKEFGQQINQLKHFTNEKFITLKKDIESSDSTHVDIDFSLPPEPIKFGSRHPISSTRREIVEIFARIGFSVFEGPEINAAKA